MAPSPFPPSFDGNPWTYGMALCSLTTMSALSMTLLLRYVNEHRAYKKAWELSIVPRPPLVRWDSPVILFKLILVCLLLTVLFGTFPDVLVLYSWGEATDQTMAVLFLLDRIGDAMAVLPFIAAIIIREWSNQVMPQQLVRRTAMWDGMPLMTRPRWKTFKGVAKIVSVTVVIAIGVTLAKAGIGG